MRKEIRPPHIPFYPDDFLGSGKVAVMNTTAIGAYFLLLLRAWREKPPCSIPNDDKVLSQYTKLSMKDWLKVKMVVLSPWKKCKNNRLFQPRLRREFQKYLHAVQKMSIAGRKSSKMRQKTDSILSCDTINKLTHLASTLQAPCKHLATTKPIKDLKK